MSLQVAIAHHDTIGLAQDAAVLGDAILAARPSARIAEWTIPPWCLGNRTAPMAPPDELRSFAPLDFLFLLEHAHANPPIFERSFARRVVYVPNIEWIDPYDEEVLLSGVVDAVLLKTRHAFRLFPTLPCAAKTQGACFYTGWTSADVGGTAFARADLEFLHVVGASVQKGVDAVVQAWLGKPGYPRLTVTAFASGPVDLRFPVYAANNLKLLLARLPLEDLRSLQRRTAVHLCPSVAEGFGHSINEARSAAAVVVTTGAPPMNEFVEDGLNGFLVPIRPGNSRPYHLSSAYFATADDIGATVEKVLATSLAERARMGDRAREAFLSERDAFAARISRFLDDCGP